VTPSALCGSAVSANPNKLVALGRISGVFGVKGWVKIHSYTEPRENIVAFPRWTVRQHGVDRAIEIEEGRGHGGGVVAKLKGVDDRDRARELVGADVFVARAVLPECEPGEYYWTDLEGLEVRTPGGEALGVVDHLVATGANDVLVLVGAPGRMIPFVVGEVIRSVDLDAGVIVADWSPEF
jgi:16S rRNA processing protein RimM